MKLNFAFSTFRLNIFEPEPLGDTNKFLIYKWADNKLQLEAGKSNILKDMAEAEAHGSPIKVKTIIDFLKGLNINELVSR